MKTVLILACALVLSAGPAAAERLPVSSRDDQADSLANRISAVANVAAAMDARLQRIGELVGVQPGPPTEPLYQAIVSVQNGAAALLATAGSIACIQPGPPNISGGETIADDDVRAEDTSSEGIVGQLGAIAIVLGQANARLSGIADVVATQPGPPDIEAATAVWAEAAAIFNRTADLLANADHLPPNPVCPAG